MEILLSALDSAATCKRCCCGPTSTPARTTSAKRSACFRDEARPDAWLRTLTNLTPENYLKVLANAACAVGNSSSFVRDAGYFGTPVVLVGNRQEGRETTST